MRTANRLLGILGGLGLVLSFSATAQTPSFIPANIAVLRLGDGTQALTNSGNSVFLDQYTTAGALVDSHAVPDVSANALVLSGAASSEGGLTRSLDRTLLVLTGYNTDRGSASGSLASTAGTAVPRGVATIDAFGAYTLVQTSTSVCSGNNIRCGTTDGTNHYWTAGGNSGTCYFNPPNPPLTNQITIGNTRYVKAINGNLYFSTQSGTPGIYAFAGGLPTGSSTPSLVFGTGASSQVAAFDISPSLTVAYVADQRNTAGGIQKWTSTGGTWSLAYTFGTGAGAFGVVADFSGSAPVVYATTGESSANRLVRIVDTNSSATVTLLATAGSNRWFRGVDLVPDLRPVILTQPQSQVVTNGADASFAVTVSSIATFGYQWQKNGTNIDGATDATLVLHSVTAANQATYRAVVTNQYGVVASADASLTVHTVLFPPVVTSDPQSYTNSLGGGVAFAVSASGTEPLHYQWQFNSSDLSGETNSSLTLGCLSAAAQGSYRVQITNAAGTTNSAAAFLTVLVPAASCVAYTIAGSIYAQDFNSLPNSGINTVNADNPVIINGIGYGLANPFDFAAPVIACDDLGGLGRSAILSGWYGAGDDASKFGASAGDQSTGGIISFGSTNSVAASTNRALGLLATSSTGGTAFGVKLINEATNDLTRMTLHFTGELWRQSVVPKRLAFSYWIDPTATNTLSTNITATLTNLDVSFPTDPAATNPVPLDGTAPANQLGIGVVSQPITNWPPGAALWLVWRMANPASKGQAVAVDDLTFSASPPVPIIIPTSLGIQLSGTNVVLSWPAAASGYVLEANTDVSQSRSWSTVAEPPVATNNLNTVTVPLGAHSQYFRLKQ